MKETETELTIESIEYGEMYWDPDNCINKIFNSNQQKEVIN